MRGAGGGPKNPKVSLAPLVKALVRRGVLEPDDDVTPTSLAGISGMARQSTTQWIRSGELTVWSADQAAVRALNVHPTHIWGDDWLLPVDADIAGRSLTIDIAFAALKEQAS